MAGTREGGLAAAAKNKEKFGNDFYKRIGAIGGANGHSGGFKDRELARRAGAISGSKSKRRKANDQ